MTNPGAFAIRSPDPRAQRRSGRVGCLVLPHASGLLPRLLDDSRIGVVHAMSSTDAESVQDAVRQFDPGVIVVSQSWCHELLSSPGRAVGKPVIAVALERDACPKPPRHRVPAGWHFVSLPTRGATLGPLIQLLCGVASGAEQRTRARRALIVSPRSAHVSALIQGLLNNDPPIAPLLVDTVRLATEWLGHSAFDCVIAGSKLSDGHASDCLAAAAREGLAVIGVCAMKNARDVKRFVQNGCNDLLSPEDLVSRRGSHARIHAAIAGVRSRRGFTSDEDRRLVDELLVEQERLITAARADRLTGVLNRAAFEDVLQDVHQRSQSGACAYALLSFDVDQFKAINDRLGHVRGDDVLRLVAKTMAETLGSDGLLGRLGGEEFAVVCEGVTQDAAMTLAENIRRAIAAASPGDVRLSVSGGVAYAAPGASMLTTTQMRLHADTALYEAKRSGRNRVLLAAA